MVDLISAAPGAAGLEMAIPRSHPHDRTALFRLGQPDPDRLPETAFLVYAGVFPRSGRPETWGMLHDRDADLIVNGHAHRYERFAPMTPVGTRSDNGIRQIVAGTGGQPGGSEISYADAPNLQRVETDV